MRELVGIEGDKRLSTIGMEQMLVSMGHQSCGEVTLWNYPSWMRNLVVHDINGKDRPDPVDMATLESNPSHASLAIHYFSFLLFSFLQANLILQDD
jgi:hypothetical protein